VSAYVRPSSVDEALELLADPAAAPLGGGTDLAGQVDRRIRQPELLVDLQATGLDELRADGDGLLVGATVTLAELAASPLLEPYGVVVAAAAQAASPLLRNVGTVGGNLCQHTRCWYYRGLEWHCWLGGGDTCYAQIGDHRKHGLEPGDCISAHPSDLAPAFAACGAAVLVRSRDGERELPLLELYRGPTSDNRSLLTLGAGELVTAVRLPAPPEASAYERAGERRAFSFPLVAVAAARRGSETRLVAGGVANVPRELDPADPLAGLPGNPQSAWKCDLLSALAERALAAVSGS
jgi:CO/xanthine dehydrogenase FAD-binding subunit